MNRSAHISDCGEYRYSLERRWGNGKYALWIMLNPSTADAKNDDATIRRCIGLTKGLNTQFMMQPSRTFGGIKVVNLFAYRAKNPAMLKLVEDPVGMMNTEILAGSIVDADLIICAWGSHGGLFDRDRAILSMINSAHGHVGECGRCFGVTNDGFPKHPLYLRSDVKLVPYYGRP